MLSPTVKSSTVGVRNTPEPRAQQARDGMVGDGGAQDAGDDRPRPPVMRRQAPATAICVRSPISAMAMVTMATRKACTGRSPDRAVRPRPPLPLGLGRSGRWSRHARRPRAPWLIAKHVDARPGSRPGGYSPRVPRSITPACGQRQRAPLEPAPGDRPAQAARHQHVGAAELFAVARLLRADEGEAREASSPAAPARGRAAGKAAPTPPARHRSAGSRRSRTAAARRARRGGRRAARARARGSAARRARPADAGSPRGASSSARSPKTSRAERAAVDAAAFLRDAGKRARHRRDRGRRRARERRWTARVGVEHRQPHAPQHRGGGALAHADRAGEAERSSFQQGRDQRAAQRRRHLGLDAEPGGEARAAP